MPPFIILLLAIITSGLLALAGQIGLIETPAAAWLSGLFTGLLISYIYHKEA